MCDTSNFWSQMLDVTPKEGTRLVFPLPLYAQKETFQKNPTVPKNGKDGTLWASLSSSLLQKIKITKEGRYSWAISINFGKNVSQCRRKTVKANFLSCLVTTKALKPMVAKGGIIWKPKVACK